LPVASIVILCHNDRGFLRGCVSSLRRHTRLPHELVLVDNGSEDGVEDDLRRIRRTYPHPVRLIRNRENRFFSGGNNQGIRASRGRHLVLLNADTVVTPGWLSGLIRAAEANPGVGMVGPYTNHAAGLQVLWPPGYKELRELPAWSRSWAQRRKGRVRLVPGLIGFCVLVPRAVLDRVGLLDEGFGPGGFEDYDFCLRLRLAGCELAIAEEVYVHHFGGRGYVNMRYDALREENRALYWEKWGQRCRSRCEDARRRRSPLSPACAGEEGVRSR